VASQSLSCEEGLKGLEITCGEPPETLTVPRPAAENLQHPESGICDLQMPPGKFEPFKDLQTLHLARLNITVAGLKHLKDLEKLDLLGCRQVRDLAALEGFPLPWLNLFDCPQVHDLTPLAGMNLSEIFLTPRYFTRDGLEALRRCKTLKAIVIGYKPADRLAPEDFWKKFDAGEFKP
jgi:hypothetical protein